MKRWIHCGGFYRNININVRKMSVRRTRSVASQVAACLDEEDLRDAAESDEAELVDVPRVDRKKDTRVDAIIEAALDEEERLDELDEFTTAANAHYQAAGICVPDGDAAHVGASAEASLEHEHGMEDVETVSNGALERSRDEFWYRRMDSEREAELLDMDSEREAELLDKAYAMVDSRYDEEAPDERWQPRVETYEEWYVAREERLQEERIREESEEYELNQWKLRRNVALRS